MRFQNPEITVVNFQLLDVITTSSTVKPEGGSPNLPMTEFE